MTEDEQRSPRIAGCRWGRVSIDGHGTVKDAKLYPGGARAWDWGETGTRHEPGIQPADVVELLEHGAEVVVLSRGVLRMLKVCPETLLLLKDKGIPCQVLPTPEAVTEYNRLAETEAVGALIHSTC
ncbi:MAG: Mth938-like domain-containing protein [Rhodospirillales bacterium]